MKRWLLRTGRQAWRRAGPAGMLAFTLLVAAALVAMWVPRLMRQGDELRASLAGQAHALTRQTEPAQRRASGGETATRFMAGFPPLTQSSRDLSEVFEIAARRNVGLLRGEYQLKADPGTALVTYSVTLPLRNEYGAIKGFTAEVLEALPHAALDELRMTRPDAGSGLLDSVIRFTLIYRSP